MTDPLIVGDAAEPREWDIGNRTLISSADQRHALGVLNARYPLLLPVRSVLKFDDVLDDQRVAGVGVIADQGSGIVCGEVGPVTGTPQGIAGANPAGPVARACTCMRCAACRRKWAPRTPTRPRSRTA
jgi:hypothetical protein